MKQIKFDLPIDGVKVATLDELRDHFTTEIINHFRDGLLARWLQVRDLAGELEALERLKENGTDDDAGTLKALCRIFEVEVNDAAIKAALAEPTGVPGIRPSPAVGCQRREPEREERGGAEEEGKPVGHVFRDGPAYPEMVVVPAGSFMMGTSQSEEGRDDDEGPVHRVMISEPLAVGVYAVTFDEWDACVRDGGGCGGYWPDDEGWGRGRRPVINVSWEDAKAYVSWLSVETGEAYRLLSEAEWEYVARAGTTTPFHTGRTISTDQANYDGDYTYGSGREGRYRKKTIPVGSFAANAFGLHDVHGNVWEWVEDCWHGNYADAPENGITWTWGGDCSVRVMRGGSWYKRPDYIRSGFRRRRGTSNRDETYGFRVARTLAK